MMSGKIDAKREDRIKRKREEGEELKNIRIEKVYIATKGALRNADIASAILLCRSPKSAPL